MGLTGDQQGEPGRRTRRRFRAKAERASDRRVMTGVSLGIAVLGPVTGFFLGAGIQPDRLYWWWLIPSAFTGTVFLALLLWRSRLERQQKERGTLYYVRFLDSAMADIHESTLEQIRGGYLDLRTVTRSCPPYDDRTDADDARPAMLDVSSAVAECSHSLELATSSDALDTQFTYAPNVLFPMGVSIGYQTYFMGNTTFVELPSPPNQKKAEPGRWRLRGESEMKEEKLSWPVESIPWSRLEREDADGPVGGADTDGPVALLWNMTPKCQLPPLPKGWRIPEERHYVLGDGRIDYRIQATESPENDEWVNTMAAACARSLWKLDQKHPRSPIVLCARLPKTLQLAIGWRMAQRLDKTDDVQSKLCSPWERLITLQYTTAGPWVYTITRVHPAQPTLTQMMTMLFGRPCPGGSSSGFQDS